MVVVSIHDLLAGFFFFNAFLTWKNREQKQPEPLAAARQPDCLGSIKIHSINQSFGAQGTAGSRYGRHKVWRFGSVEGRHGLTLLMRTPLVVGFS